MSSPNNHHAPHSKSRSEAHSESGESRRDVLVSRIVDRAESAEDWAAFRSIAANDPGAWELLAASQRENAELRALAHQAVAVADAVELPAPRERMTVRSLPFRMRLAVGAGWAAAAALALAWTFGAPHPFGSSEDNGTQEAGILQSASDAWKAYLDSGRKEGTVVAEVEPKVLLDSHELKNGGFEVIFVRQVIERRQVPTLVRFSGTDEHGTPTPVRVQLRSRSSL